MVHRQWVAQVARAGMVTKGGGMVTKVHGQRVVQVARVENRPVDVLCDNARAEVVDLVVELQESNHSLGGVVAITLCHQQVPQAFNLFGVLGRVVLVQDGLEWGVQLLPGLEGHDADQVVEDLAPAVAEPVLAEDVLCNRDPALPWGQVEVDRVAGCWDVTHPSQWHRHSDGARACFGAFEGSGRGDVPVCPLNAAAAPCVICLVVHIKPDLSAAGKATVPARRRLCSVTEGRAEGPTQSSTHSIHGHGSCLLYSGFERVVFCPQQHLI